MKKLLYLLFTGMVIVSSVFMAKTVWAHGSGPPFVKINGDYTPTNPLTVYTFPEEFELGSDVASPAAYLVNTELLFDVDENNFPNPYAMEVDRTGVLRKLPESQIPKSVFRWDFGDNSSLEEGKTIAHTYTKPGTYIAALQVKYPDKLDSFGTANTIQINILPDRGYRLPLAVAQVDGHLVKNAEKDVIEIELDKEYTFDASRSTGNITNYIWDFNDGTAKTGKTVKHTFTDPDLIAIYPTLRVIDTNDIISDTFISLDIVEKKNFFITLLEKIKSFFKK